jgi:hypothetical protein
MRCWIDHQFARHYVTSRPGAADNIIAAGVTEAGATAAGTVGVGATGVVGAACVCVAINRATIMAIIAIPAEIADIITGAFPFQFSFFCSVTTAS